MRLFTRLAVVVAALMLCACSRDSPSEPASVPNLVTNGSFSASIEGASWSAVGNVSVVKRDDNITVTAVSSTYNITLSLGHATLVGDYPLIVPSIFGPSASVMNASGARWVTGGIGATGLVTITTLTASRIAGTFAFAGLPVTGGAVSLVHVTRGTFDVTY
jgi:hypothetical protein